MTTTDIKRAVDEVLQKHYAGRGGRVLVPGAKVTSRYQNRQPRTYTVDGRELSAGQYKRLRQALGLRRSAR